ncbi:VPLPA-CTERM sorting domain-containing protein [Rhodobacter capsulatus]|uniref:VPLPA-CTERM sorting domain-containing protein n=1 Tax=Rhodobacter capsulatus TaxID=1061 RepID=UPI00402505F4
MKVNYLATAAIVLAAAGSSAGATTVTFSGGTTAGSTYTESGFAFANFTSTNGQCGPDAPCMMLNPQASTTMTLVGGGTFSLTQLGVNFQGTGGRNPSSFSITGYVDSTVQSVITITESLFSQHHYRDIDLASVFNTYFSHVTSVVFAGLVNANVRVDNILAEADDNDNNVPETPLPATGLLLVGALGAASALRRRQKTQG